MAIVTNPQGAAPKMIWGTGQQLGLNSESSSNSNLGLDYL